MNPRWRLAAAVIGLSLVALTAWLLAQADPVTRRLLGNSAKLALGACAISLPVGTILAGLLVRTDLPGRRAAGWLLAMLLFLPLYLQAAGWDAGFGRQGWYSYAVTSLAAPVLAGWGAAIWIHALAAIPWTVAIVAVGLLFVEPALEEQASLDGSPWQVFWQVTVPRASRSMGVAGLWTLVSVSGEITVTDMYQVSTYARELYQGFALGDEWTTVGRSLLPGMTALLAIVLALLFLMARPVGRDQLSMQRPSCPFLLGRWRWLAAAAAWFVVGLLVLVPAGNLLYKAGLSVEWVGGERWRVWSAAKFVRILLLVPRRFAGEIGWTLGIGTVAATFTTLLAAPLAWYGRGGGARLFPAAITAALGFAVPGPLIGLSLIWLLNRESPVPLYWLYEQTVAAPVLAMSIRGLPLATVICWFGWRTVPREQLDAATLDGAGPVTRFLCVALPARQRVVFLAWLAAFAISAGDLAASILVLPPNVHTLGPRIFDLLHAGVDDQVAGLCLVSAGGFASLAMLAGWALSRDRSAARR